MIILDSAIVTFIIVLWLQLGLIQSNERVEFPITFHYILISDNDTKPLVIVPTIQFCIGTPSQCFDLTVDTMTSTPWITDEHQKEYFNHSYISTASSSHEGVNQTFSFLFNGAYLSGTYIKEIVSPLEGVQDSSVIKMPLGLVNASDINERVLTKDGTIGITKFSMFDSQRNTSNNYLDYLKSNKLITERIVSFEFNDLISNKGIISFGTPSKAIKHKCGKDVKYYSASWVCYVNYFSLGKEKIDTPNEVVIFDSLQQYIYAPYEGGFFILNKLLKLSNEHCTIKVDSEDGIYTLRCDIGVDVSVYEDIVFHLGESEFIIYAKDLFAMLPSNKEYICLLRVKRNERFQWLFGLIAFKHKMISLNQDDMSAGFTDYRTMGGSSIKTTIFIIVSIIIIVIVILIGIYIRRKMLLNRPRVDINFSLVS